jgi:hypothetical protein
LSPRQTSGSASGQGDSKDAKERAAKKACLNGEAEKGIKLLTDLYVDTNDPNYIFNQGRCYEQGSLYREAIERFREYLRKAKAASDAERAEANKHIADCKAVMDAPKQDVSLKVEEPPRQHHRSRTKSVWLGRPSCRRHRAKAANPPEPDCEWAGSPSQRSGLPLWPPALCSTLSTTTSFATCARTTTTAPMQPPAAIGRARSSAT